MKKIASLTLGLMTAVALLSCGNKTANATDEIVADSVADTVRVEEETGPQTISVEKATYSNEDEYCKVTMSLQLPVDDGSMSSTIRDNIIRLLNKNIPCQADYGEGNRVFASYSGKDMSVKALCNYYGKHVFDYNRGISKQTAEDDAANGLDDMSQQWEFSFTLKKAEESDRYVVFYEEVYGFTAGAHGGVYGLGPMTFDKRTGEQFTDFIKPGAVRQLQKLIRKGLVRYFCESGEKIKDSDLRDYLLLDGSVIPLPQQYGVYPSAKGIEFLYGQYEIAPYAAGMPSFCISYDQIKPYLTNEAIEFLGI